MIVNVFKTYVVTVQLENGQSCNKVISKVKKLKECYAEVAIVSFAKEKSKCNFWGGAVYINELILKVQIQELREKEEKEI